MPGQQVWISPPAALGIEPVCLYLDATEDVADVTRRVSRVATLDGGAAIFDGGYSVTDREFSWSIQTGHETAETVISWVQAYPVLHLMVRDMALAVVPRGARYRSGVLRVSLYVQSDLRA